MKYLINGEFYDPIKCGAEEDLYYDQPKSICGDCGVGIDNYHKRGCDIEKCPSCKGQLITCDCQPIYMVNDEEIEDANYIKYLTIKQQKERELMSKAFAQLKKGEIDKRQYAYKVNRWDDCTYHKPYDDDITRFDLLVRLYNVKNSKKDLNEKIETILAECDYFGSFLGLYDAYDIACDKLMCDFTEYFIECRNDGKDLNQLISKNLKVDEYYAVNDNGVIINVDQKVISDIVNNVANYVFQQLEKENQM